EDVDDRERDQEAEGERAPDAPTAKRLRDRRHRGRRGAHFLPLAVANARARSRPGRRSVSRSRVTIRVRIVKKTMIAKRMNASAAPTPHSFVLNDVLNERYAGVSVVFSGLPFEPT